MSNKLITRHVYNFSPEDNGGEGVVLVTEFHDNGDGEIYTDQTLILQSYSRSASVQLGSCLTPDKLRELANQLESTSNKI